MRPIRRLVVLLVLASLAAPAAAESYKVFARASPDSGEAGPQVEYNPARGGFLVLGRERWAVKTRLVERDGLERQPVMPPAVGHPYYEMPRLAYNPKAGSYLLSARSYTRLDQEGRQIGADRHYQLPFSHGTLALSAIAGRDTWFAVLEGCKYGCFSEGYVVGRGGALRQAFGLSDLPFDDQYVNFSRRWQAGFDSERQTFLVVWEDGYDDDYEKPSNAIFAQRLRANGKPLGRRLTIATHARNASQPDLYYHEARAEWLMVYRDGRRVKGRFLRGGRRSPPFVIGMRGDVPSIAYAADHGAYLVTWTGADGAGGLYGRWVRADGDPLGARFTIVASRRGVNLGRPGYVACGPAGDCLVAWVDDQREGVTRARFVVFPSEGPA